MPHANVAKLAQAALAVLCLVGSACSSRPPVTGGTRPMPPEGSGIHAPIVDAALPADFKMRWPANASARVTYRISFSGQPDASTAIAQTITLGAPDSEGRRRLTSTEFEGAGGHTPDLIALEFSGRPSILQREVLIGPDARPIPATSGVFWRSWVWTAKPDEVAGELGSDVEFKVENLGTSPFAADAVRLVEHIKPKTEAGARGLSRLGFDALGVPDQGIQFADYKVTIDTNPRTLQPLRVELQSELTHPVVTTMTMTFEFDWQPARAASN